MGRGCWGARNPCCLAPNGTLSGGRHRAGHSRATWEAVPGREAGRGPLLPMAVSPGLRGLCRFPVLASRTVQGVGKARGTCPLEVLARRRKV